MDVMKTETSFEPFFKKAGQSTERLVPIEDYAREIGISQRAAARYAKAGQIDTKEQEGRTYVVDKPLAEKDWFEFGVVRTQARARARWQIACLTLAVLLVGAVTAGSAAGVWLWGGMNASAQTLSETQDRLTNSGEQIADMQLQLADERRGHASKLEAQRADFEARASAFATAEAQLKRAADQFKALQAQLADERQDHKAEIRSQQVTHAATVDQLHAGISDLAAHIVELSKAVSDVQPVP